MGSKDALCVVCKRAFQTVSARVRAPIRVCAQRHVVLGSTDVPPMCQSLRMSPPLVYKLPQSGLAFQDKKKKPAAKPKAVPKPKAVAKPKAKAKAQGKAKARAQKAGVYPSCVCSSGILTTCFKTQVSQWQDTRTQVCLSETTFSFDTRLLKNPRQRRGAGLFLPLCQALVNAARVLLLQCRCPSAASGGR